MAVHVVGVWELGWDSPIREVNLWGYPLRDFAVDRVIMTPVSGIRTDLIHEEAEDLGTLLARYRANGFSVVHLTERGEEMLEDFVHPLGDVVYVFGKVSYDTWVAHGQIGDRAVKMRTPMNQGLPWPHQVACVTLYDRMMKQ